MHGIIPRIAMLVLCAIAAYLYWQHREKIYEDKGRLIVTQEGDAVVLSWSSGIDVPMVKRFEEAYANTRNQTDAFVIDLNSPGGALREGSKLIELIGRMKKSHTITTRVRSGNYCLSMCVPIYLQGENRVASPSSNWMFHEPQSVDYFTGEEDPGPEFEREYYNERFFERYFVNSDIAPAWRDQLRQEWVGKDVWRTGQQLVDEGSNIILELQ